MAIELTRIVEWLNGWFPLRGTETRSLSEVVSATNTSLDNKVNVLLTPRCGENASDVLGVADIKIYKSNSISAKGNIDTFIAGKLPLLDEIHAGFHGHGEN